MRVSRRFIEPGDDFVRIEGATLLIALGEAPILE
jgi:hypothetical protein